MPIQLEWLIPVWTKYRLDILVSCPDHDIVGLRLLKELGRMDSVGMTNDKAQRRFRAGAPTLSASMGANKTTPATLAVVVSFNCLATDKAIVPPMLDPIKNNESFVLLLLLL